MLVMGLDSAVPLIVAEAAVLLRKILSLDKNPPIAEVLAAQSLPRLRNLLGDSTRPSVQLEACWCLTNIASGSPDQTQAVVECGAVPLFVQLLLSNDPALQEQAIWAMANIAGDRPEYRDGCISVGTVEALSSILDSAIRTKSTQIARLGAWGLSNLCRGRPAPDLSKIAPALPSLGRALSVSNDSEILADTAWGLSYLTDSCNSDITNHILKFFDLKRIVSLLGHPSSCVHTPILRVIGNLVSGQSDITLAVVSAGALSHLKSLAFVQKKSVRKEALWAISNVSADSHATLQSVIDCGLMGLICDIVRDGRSDSELRKEAIWTLCNAATVGNRDQIYTLVLKDRYKMAEVMCDFLETCRDPKTTRTVVDAIYAILCKGEDEEDTDNPFTGIIEECGGLAIIEDLQEDESPEVYEGAIRVLERFFDCEEVAQEQQPVARFDFSHPTGSKDGMPILPFARSG